MENTRVLLLFVITLLQLCRAEISDNLPESWYSANVIHDGLQPKPISEIFSTDHPFSSRNPIIVLPKSTSMPDITHSSSLPSSNLNYEEFSKASIIPSSTPFPAVSSTIPSQASTDFTSPYPSQPPNVEITQFTEQTLPPSESLPKSQSKSQTRTLSSSVQPSTIEQQTTQTQPHSPSGQFLIPGNNVPDYLYKQQQTSASTPGLLPNYFLIYQQVPQNFQEPHSQQPSLLGGLFGVPALQQGTTSRLPDTTIVIQPSTTISPLSTLTTSRNTISSTSSRTSQRKSVTPSSRRPVQASTRRTPTTSLLKSSRPCQNVTYLPGIGNLPLRIRVTGPKGSITHVNINPPVSLLPSTTTKKPSTTTTRKTPKPKKNTYEACLGGCRARRDPICAIPLSATWIDPERLKGFPSVCHMACFNSYKKEPYEKVLDGRCGRLRTRIHIFNSKTKLRRDELNKAEYVIDDGDKTIIEVSPLR